VQSKNKRNIFQTRYAKANYYYTIDLFIFYTTSLLIANIFQC